MCTRTVLALLCSAQALAAQPRPALVPPPAERSLHGTYDEAASREMFTACDADSDDRLDVFETSSALDALRDPRDAERFARFDTDRDGYVTWPEFDALLRRQLAETGVFCVRTCRQFPPKAQAPRASTPLQQFLQAHDGDRDGSLSLAEAQQMIARLGLDAAFAGRMQDLDRDGSGSIDEAELAPFFETLPLLSLFQRPVPIGTAALPPPFAAADTDGNAALDEKELELLLQRLDPQLARWTPQLLRRLDKNEDGKLVAAELPQPPAPTGVRREPRTGSAPPKN